MAAREIALLPSELRPFYEARERFIVERVVDPDLWRNVGWDDEPPNHFVDFGFDGYGAYPFAALPRSYDQAVQKFGPDVVHEQGLLPWRTAEFYGRLQRAFESLRQPTPSTCSTTSPCSRRGAVPLRRRRARAAPRHQELRRSADRPARRALALRERALRALHRALAVPPRPPARGHRPARRDVRVLLDSYRLVEPMLAADKRGRRGPRLLRRRLLRRLRRDALPIVDQRIDESIAAVGRLHRRRLGAGRQAGGAGWSCRATPRRIPRR